MTQSRDNCCSGPEGELLAISEAAARLALCPATLRIWERKGLIQPRRLGKNRLFSSQDMALLRQIKDLLQKQGMNIEGVRAVLYAKQCWDVNKCAARKRSACPFYRSRAALRSLPQPRRKTGK